MVKSRWAGGARASSDSSLALLRAGGDAATRVPQRRWDAEPASPPAVLHGAFLAYAECFDPLFFGISPAEATATDPQQRLLLQSAYTAVHTACHRRHDVDGAGVFLGIMNADFVTLPQARSGSVYEATGSAISIAAGRISFVLGSQGPCASIDTACSSALVALHWAALSLDASECTEALSLAASLMLTPQRSHIYARAGMLSDDGRCKTFDIRANGYARGEGV